MTLAMVATVGRVNISDLLVLFGFAGKEKQKT